MATMKKDSKRGFVDQHLINSVFITTPKSLLTLVILKDDAWTEQANLTSADKKHKIIDPLRLRRNEKSTTALLPPKAEIA